MIDPAALWEEIERSAPDLAKLTYPRNYAAAGAYHSPKALSAGMVMAILGMTKGKMSQTGVSIKGEPILAPDDINTVHAYACSLRLLTFMVPTYFVAPDLLKAAMATRLPGDLNINDIHWPFPAIKFVFPRGGVYSPHDGEIPGLVIAKTEAGTYGHENLPPITGDAPGIGLFTIAVGNGCPIFASHLDTRNETTAAWMKRITAIDAMLFAPETKKHFGDVVGTDHPEYALMKEQGGITKTTDADKQFIDELSRLGLKLIMIMGARPHFLEQSVLIREASHKKGKEKSELWSPSILGRHYQLQRAAGERGEPTGRHVTLHPVCGHTRMQPYGPRDNPTYKSIWIEPTWSGTNPSKNAA